MPGPLNVHGGTGELIVSNAGTVFANGESLPTGPGFATGCPFIKTGDDAGLYVNAGDVDAADFSPSASFTHATIAAMTARSAPDNSIHQTLGYSTAGVGAGTYIYHRTGRPTADNGFYFNGPQSDDYYELIDKTVARATQFGIDADDDSTDDTTQFTRLLNSGAERLLVEEGVTVNLIAWTPWSTTRSLRVDCYGTIKGDGSDNFISITEGHSLEWYGHQQGTFSTWDDCIVLASAATSHESIVVDGMAFTTMDRAFSDSGATLVLQTKRFHVTRCSFTACDENGILHRAQVQLDTYIANNRFTAMGGTAAGCTAIQIGSDESDSHGSVEICHNYIDSVTSTGASTETHGIIVFGRHASIHHNEIRTVNNSNGTADEGLYTKISYGTVSDNLLVNAGNGEASLKIKGRFRGEGGTNPDGFAVCVERNTVLADDATNRNAAIATRNDDCLVRGNTIEGYDRAILVEGDWTTVSENTIRCTFAATNIGIQVTSSDHTQILGNRFPAFGNAGTISWLIYLRATATMTDCVIANNIGSAVGTTKNFVQAHPSSGITLSGVLIVGNRISDLTNALDFDAGDSGTLATVRMAGNEWPSATLAVDANADSVVVIEGGRDVSVTAAADPGTAIPADARFVTVTSASADNIVVLPDVPAGREVVGYVGANGCEFYSTGTNITINGVICSATNEAAMPANSLWRATRYSSTDWTLTYDVANTGAAGATITPNAR
jgi:hypothetical protein